jgi:ATP:cob(I)alamin adenosyltransferase
MITTKKGDGGRSEYFGKKVSKGGKLLEAVGALDELQAVIQLVNYELRIKNLEKISNDLYLIMGRKLTKGRIEWLKKEINKLEKEIIIKKKFIIFKNEKALKLNWVRTVVRRAERTVVRLEIRDKILDKNVLIYLNRLSDFIYLLALQQENKVED